MRLANDTKRFLKATATLFGAIIGVGIFGVPYVLSRSGIWVGAAFFLLLTGVQLLQHLFLAEAAMASPERARLVGLARQFLGRRAARLAGVASIVGMWAAILAYFVVGGAFLHTLFSPFFGGTPHAYQWLWAIVGSAVLYFGLDIITRIDVAATVAMLIAVILIIIRGAPHLFVANFAPPFHPDYLLPYGVILFSLTGMTAIPEMEDILAGRHKRYRLAIVIATIAAAVLTAAFGYVVLGVTGAATTANAVDGLRNVLRNGIASVAAMFGFLAMATSFFPTGANIKETFVYDYGMPRFKAWALTIGVPLALFIFGATNFISVIGFAGAVVGGVTGIIIALMYVVITKKRLLQRKALGAPLWLAYAVVAIFCGGAALSIAESIGGMFRK